MAISLPSRGLRGYAGGIFAGCVSVAFFGVGFSYANTVFVLIAYMAAVPLFIAGLGAGAISGSIASITGMLVLFFVRPPDFALLYGVAFGLPVSVLIALTLRHDGDTPTSTTWYPESNIFTAILLYPCVAFLAACAAAQSHGGLLAQTQAGMVGAIALMKDRFKDQFDAETMQRFLSAMNHFARLLPSLLGIFWILIVSMSLVVAHTTLKQQNWNLRPSFDPMRIGLPKWLIGLVVLAALACASNKPPLDYIGINLSVLFGLAYIIVGLIVIHAYAGQYKWGNWTLLGIYSVLLLAFQWTLLPFVAVTLFLGLSDQWIDFRRRFAGMKQGG